MSIPLTKFDVVLRCYSLFLKGILWGDSVDKGVAAWYHSTQVRFAHVAQVELATVRYFQSYQRSKLAGPQEINYRELQPGHEFPSATYRIDASTLEAFLRAVGEETSLYENLEIVPPMAVTAFAMAALSESMSLPWGSIHVSQEMGFTNVVRTGDAITSSAWVTRNHKRGNMHLLAIELKALDSNDNLVLTGRTTFVLPE